MHRGCNNDRDLTTAALAIEAGDGRPQGKLPRVGLRPLQVVRMHLAEVRALLARDEDRHVREHGLLNGHDGTAIATQSHGIVLF